MTDETAGSQAGSPGRSATGPITRPAAAGTVASWLSGLLNPGKRGGRLKGATLKSLLWLGVIAVVGMGVMGLGDLFRPARQAGDTGQSALPVTGAALGAVAAGTSADGTDAAAASQGIPISVADLESMIERHLERILSHIQGAGEVTVAVSLQTGATYVYGYDETQMSQTTQERDANGGTRTVTETNSSKEAVVVTQGTTSQPVVVTVELPPLDGVVVVATGARDSHVKALLARAVQVLYGVPAHRVEVLPGG